MLLPKPGDRFPRGVPAGRSRDVVPHPGPRDRADAKASIRTGIFESENSSFPSPALSRTDRPRPWVINRRDGKLASSHLPRVIFTYYVLLWLGQSLVRGNLAPPWLAAWMPNIALGGLGALLFAWKGRAGDRAIRLRGLPSVPTMRIPPLKLPMLGILDRYVASTYTRVAGLSAIAMAGIFYISTFLDLSDKVFRGQAPGA